jgi:hypothetical protein
MLQIVSGWKSNSHHATNMTWTEPTGRGILVVQRIMHRVECYAKVDLCPIVFEFRSIGLLICLVGSIAFLGVMHTMRQERIHEGFESRYTALRQLHLREYITIPPISTGSELIDRAECEPFQLQTRPVRVLDQIKSFAIHCARKPLAGGLRSENPIAQETTTYGLINTWHAFPACVIQSWLAFTCAIWPM